MPTTTKMGIVYPASTDLVKDGATAMGTISTTVDSKTGLVLINTTSFTSVGSQSLNNVFTSSFKNYRIFINAKHASDADITIRLRASGTDLTSNNYLEGRYYIGSTSSLAAGSSNNTTSTSWSTTSLGTWAGQIIMDIANPQATEVTTAQTQGAGRFFITLGHSLNNITTSYDGFTIVSNGTMTGSVSVYGYNL
jgi:hypothetical protein